MCTDQNKSICLRVSAVILLLCLLIAALAGCTDSPEDLSGDTEGTEANSAHPQTAPPTDTSAEALRTYYETLIADLRESLLNERADRYMSDYEYESRLAMLEAALAELEKGNTPTGSQDNDQAGAPSEDDLPVGGVPETRAPETSLPPDRDDGDTNTDTAPSASVSFRYRIEDGHAIICEYLGGSRAVSIPSVIDGYPVTELADNAFKNTDVTSVVIPSTVTSVGWFAFYGCYALESVTIPASVTIINYAAFDGCPHLVILCAEGSYAAQYAASFGIRRQYI